MNKIINIDTDIVIVGSGIAGLYSALNIPEKYSITIVTKKALEDSNSALAQGGICVSKGEYDIKPYIEDTLKAGKYENDIDAVTALVNESKENVDKLIEYGVDFDKQHGELCYTKEAAHSTNRILHVKDETGRYIMESLCEKIKLRKNTFILENTLCSDIIENNNSCHGIIALNNNIQYNIHSQFVIMATGGIGGLFKNSTNRRHITGDGLSICKKHNIKLKNLSERMNKIITTMDQVKAGNLDVRIDITDDKDELNYIATQFNDMCIDLKNHIEISYLAEMNKKEAELSKKKAEMLSLQSKINPHFLYNTLESIRMKAIANGNRDVGRMLFLLGNLFRNQLKEDDVITIEKEINYCKEYLELFKFRYDDKFNYYINCEQELLNKEIIKFVLQPLAENYTVHGIRREDYDNELHIDISKNNDNIKIVIEDNGIGIDKNKINEINQKIKEKDFSGKSIGIANTHERIMLLYGEEYGVKVDEEFENGTRIILNIPMRGE